MAKPQVVYSASTLLSYRICEFYYNGIHYVWCAPNNNADKIIRDNPASSDPLEIYWLYRKAVKTGDEHSFQINSNRRGIARGAIAREEQGVIDRKTRERIVAIANSAPVQEFDPLLYVIPYYLVQDIIREVDLDQAARVTSLEFVIENLPRKFFDVLQLHGDLS
jgi:hypothetical protein